MFFGTRPCTICDGSGRTRRNSTGALSGAALRLALPRFWPSTRNGGRCKPLPRRRRRRAIGCRARSARRRRAANRSQSARGKDAEAANAAKAAELRREIDELLASLPNLPAPEVPDGPDETANRELRRVGLPPQFNFDVLPHEAIGEKLGLMDF